jgi:antitoxin component YwqK of YwqJK toxin-antitoxin module
MPTVPYQDHHANGSLCVKGQMLDGVAVGYWEWFRKDGTKLRSGHFADGRQTGVWTTYDKTGAVYKKTDVTKRKAASERVTLEQIRRTKRS